VRRWFIRVDSYARGVSQGTFWCAIPHGAITVTLRFIRDPGWRETDVTWDGRFQRPLERVTPVPRPGRQTVRIWHGANTNLDSAEFAAGHGDPVFTSIGTTALGRYRETVQHYREWFAFHGHDPSRALVDVDAEALSPAGYRATLELFATDIAPVVRKELPNKPIGDWRSA
jgi:hypothetical protein